MKKSMVVFDATMMLVILQPGVRVPSDSTTGKPLEFAEARVAHLVNSIEKDKTRIIVPTPVLAELLVLVGPGGPGLVSRIQRAAVFRIAPFDTRAAIEVAEMGRIALATGDKRGGIDAPWSKIKFDRQIVAVAKVRGANAIYTDDEKLGACAAANGLAMIRLADLHVPPDKQQIEIDFSKPQGAAEHDA